jgi:hypothetical protein
MLPSDSKRKLVFAQQLIGQPFSPFLAGMAANLRIVLQRPLDDVKEIPL